MSLEKKPKNLTDVVHLPFEWPRVELSTVF